ncbi:MAG TPA: DUF4129 domain-containing protein [Chloroflexota bacterium]|nr:DUF4129 domain-containing protein [Chloroflexota bacterium]
MNRALLTLGLAAMQVCWIYPWSLLVVRWIQGEPERPLLSGATMLLLILLAAFATRVVIRTVGVARTGQLTLIGTGLAIVLVAVWLNQYPGADLAESLGGLASAVMVLLGRPTTPAVALGLGLILWWRGVQLGSYTPSLPEVEVAFRWNIGALIAFGVVLAVGTRPSQQSLLEAQATPFVVGSFFVSLLTLALARLESLRSSTRALALNTQWLGVLIAVAGLLVLTALAVAQVLSFDLLIVATRPIFELLGRVLIVLLYIVIIPLAFIVEWIAYWLLSLFSPDADRRPPEPYSTGDVNTFLERLFGQLLPPEVLVVLKALGAVLLLGIALLLVARTVARWRPRLGESDATREERDSVFEPGRFRQALFAWLRRLFQRIRPVKPAARAPAADALTPAQADGLPTVRDLYRRLLALGQRAGRPRAAALTPYEHQPALADVLQPPADVHDLTEAYVEVRYAEHELTTAEIEDLQSRLDRLQPK